MKAEKGLEKDEAIFNALIDACGRQGDLRNMGIITDQMYVLKIKPSQITLSSMTNTLKEQVFFFVVLLMP
jgi:pentatricopeptide repeat protein